jgi:hypothetical protein
VKTYKYEHWKYEQRTTHSIAKIENNAAYSFWMPKSAFVMHKKEQISLHPKEKRGVAIVYED